LKRLSIILAVVLAFALMLTGCDKAGSTEADGSTPVIKIGVIGLDEGAEVQDGAQELTGVAYANYVCPEVEINGKSCKIELTDDLSGAAAVISLRGSAETAEAVKNIGDTAVISPTCTENDFAKIGENCFTACFTDSFQAQTLSEFAKERLKAQVVCCLAEKGNDSSTKLCDAFMTEFKKDGGNVIYETINVGSSDYTTVVENAVKSGADVFFAPVSTEAGAALIEEAAKQKYEKPIISGTAWDSSLIAETAHGKQVEIFITAFYMEGQNLDFDDGYKAWLGSNEDMAKIVGGADIVSSAAMKGYDAYFAVIEAIKSANSDKAADIMKALGGISAQGVCSEIAFNANRTAKNTLAYMKKCDIEEGGWDFVRKHFTDPVQPEVTVESTSPAAETADTSGAKSAG